MHHNSYPEDTAHIWFVRHQSERALLYNRYNCFSLHSADMYREDILDNSSSQCYLQRFRLGKLHTMFGLPYLEMCHDRIIHIVFDLVQ